MSEYKLTFPISEAQIRELKVGDIVYLDGKFYQGTSAPHKRMIKYLEEGKELPFNLKGSGVFHCYTSFINEGDSYKINYLGATTSASVNPYEPIIIKNFKPSVIIGKGGMNQEVLDAMQENACVYLAQVGGCSALYSSGVKGISNAFWPDLAADLVLELEADNFGPFTVAMDSHGNSIFAETEKTIKAQLAEIHKKLDQGK